MRVRTAGECECDRACLGGRDSLSPRSVLGTGPSIPGLSTTRSAGTQIRVPAQLNRMADLDGVRVHTDPGHRLNVGPINPPRFFSYMVSRPATQSIFNMPASRAAHLDGPSGGPETSPTITHLTAARGAGEGIRNVP